MPSAEVKKQDLLTPPHNAEIYESRWATCWYGEDGILYMVSKPEPRTMKNIHEYMASLEKAVRGQKVCVIADATRAGHMDKETRKYLDKSGHDFFKALGIVSSSAMGRTVANIYFTLSPRPFPVKMFGTPAAAAEWIKQYL